MHSTAISLLLAFLEGIALIISPCILPILPLILSGSLTGNRNKPYGIIAGFIIFFVMVTLFSKFIVNAAHINPSVLRYLALFFLFLLGLVLFSDYLDDMWLKISNRLTSAVTPKNDLGRRGGFLNGMLFGSLLGIIWTPCAGPILAAVIVQSVTQTTTLTGLFVAIAFAIGVSVPMLLIALLGRKLTSRFAFLRAHSRSIRKTLGLMIIIGTIALYYQDWFVLLSSRIKTQNYFHASSNLVSAYPAPEIEGIDAWINSSPLKLEQLRGKVILLDFWTYSCINCIRSLPYLKDWYNKYHDKGLVIIGIHSPEFAFEHSLGNVLRAVKTYGITYPVALDNNFVTWQNYQNSYWPAHYLIDQKGNVVYQHFGEGDYAETENVIRGLLGLNKLSDGLQSNGYGALGLTPETYLGYARADAYYNKERAHLHEPFNYVYPSDLPLNAWALQGNWIISLDRIVSGKPNASIKLNFKARHVYAVMGVSKSPVLVTIFLNGKKITEAHGRDVNNSMLVVRENRLYEIVAFPTMQEGVLEMQAADSGLELYTFTFGS